MAVFKYKAKTPKSEIKEGSLVAATKSEAGEQLRSEGLSPLHVKETKPSGKKGFLGSGGVPLIEKANLCRYLAAMIRSGLPLSE